MHKRYFIDTCIWRDFYEDRISLSGRDLGKEASLFFMKILKRNDKILFSDSLYWEMKTDYNESDIDDMLKILSLSGALIKIEITETEFLESISLSIK